MEELSKFVDRLVCKANNLTDFCNIACNEAAKEELLRQDEQVKSIAEKLNSCKEIMRETPEKVRAMKELLYEMRRQEVIMKLVLEKVESAPDQRPKKEENHFGMVTPERKTPNRPPQSSVKKIPWDKRTLSFQPAPSTGKKSANPPISLFDFAYTIVEKEFASIPKYLRGREQLGDLQRCINEIICPCLIEKYSTLSKSNSELSNFNLRQLKRHFQDQESYFPGHYFITEGDIARFTSGLIDKRLRQRLQILRQMGLMKEVRKNSIACYIWMVRVENN